MKEYLGIDLGGSKIEHGILTPEGFKLSGKEKTPKSKKEILIKLASLISNFNGNKIGLGLAGLVSKDKEEVLFSPNLPFKKFKLRFELSKLTNKEVIIENDVNCFTLAQYFLMRKKPVNLIGITLGTGIGGGIILNGKLYRGKGTAGEIGHTCILASGPRCHCGGKGCLEALASGWALEIKGREVAGRKIKVEEMAERARKGDSRYLQIFKEMGYYLGLGLANLVNLLSPDEIVLGGSLILSKDLYWEEMLNCLKNQSFPTLPLNVRVSPAPRLEGAVALGASLVARESD